VNGSVGIVSDRGGRVFAVLGMTITGGRIAEIDILADPQRLARLDLAALDG
jgi:RNA polymerase sigma-70 factor (ECF subfamily)